MYLLLSLFIVYSLVSTGSSSSSSSSSTFTSSSSSSLSPSVHSTEPTKEYLPYYPKETVSSLPLIHFLPGCDLHTLWDNPACQISLQNIKKSSSFFSTASPPSSSSSPSTNTITGTSDHTVLSINTNEYMVTGIDIPKDDSITPLTPSKLTIHGIPSSMDSVLFKTYVFPNRYKDSSFPTTMFPSLYDQYLDYQHKHEISSTIESLSLPIHPTTTDGNVYVEFPSSGQWYVVYHRISKMVKETTSTVFTVEPLSLKYTYSYGYSAQNTLSIPEEPFSFPSITTGDPLVTPLVSGQPVIGAVRSGYYQFYAINVTIPFTRVDIIVTPFTGDPDLYVSLDNRGLPSITHYQYSSLAFIGTDTVIVRQTDGGNRAGFYCNATSLIGRPCQIIIAVYGATLMNGNANFSIVATYGGGISVLTSGIPMMDTVPPNDYNYYSLAGVTPGASLLFAVTPYSGDPDLYVGSSQKNQLRPNASIPTSYCWKSNTARRDVIEVYPPPLDQTGCYCNGVPGCTYFISVTGYGIVDSTYSVLGQENMNSTYTLLEGRSQVGFVAQGETDQYIYTIPAVLGDANARRATAITMQGFSGDPDVFVTLNGDIPSQRRWDYRAIGTDGTEYIAIRNTDPQVQASPCRASNVSCPIRIAVFGYGETIAWYQIGAATSRAAILSDGVPLTDFVDANLFTYFQFQVNAGSDPNDAIIITVTSLFGDPDVYVGNSGNNRTLTPTDAPGSYIWSGDGLGSDVIFIDPADPNVLACGQPCTYMIGVNGYGGNASFVIMARTRDGRSTPLIPMVPVVDSVETGAYNRYTADFDPTVGLLEVTVTPLSGDPDLYIALDNRIVTISNFQYGSVEPSGAEDIVVRSTDRQFNITCGLYPPSTTCTASIAVFGYSQSAYTIVASKGIRILQDGIAAFGESPRDMYTYFQFTILTRRLVNIYVTPSSNDPDLFVSNTISRPNSTSWTWSSQGFGDEYVTIDPADPRANSCGYPCTYYIAVLGWHNPALYTITASSAATVALPAGVPVQGYAAPGTFAYFNFLAPIGRNGLEFIVIPVSGSPDTTIYVGNDKDPSTGRMYFPTLDGHYSWVSGTSIARNEVQIPPDDPNYRPRSNYIVGVYSDGGARFLITGATGNTIKTLQSGVPLQDTVPGGSYAYYRLQSSTYGAAMSVTITPLTGDPDCYISNNSSNPRPSSRNYNKSAVGSGTEVVVFQWNELPECQNNLSPSGSNGVCSIYIAVYGWTNTSYTIVGDVGFNNTQYIELVDGQPQGGFLAPSTWGYYYARVNFPPTTTYSVYVRSQSGDPDLYVTTDGLGVPTTNPNHYQYSSNHAMGDELVNIAPGTNGYNSSTLMIAGVFAWGTTPAQFTITYSSASAVTALSDGIAESGYVASGQYVYYSFPAAQPSLSTSWSVTALSGQPNIYIGVWPPLNQRYRPSKAPNGYTWAGTATGNDFVTINPFPADPNACRNSCQYIAGIYCASAGNCRYTVSATQGSNLLSLVDGQPASGRVSLNNYVYYSFMVPQSGQRNVTIRVSSSLGTAQLYVTNRYDPSCQPACGALPMNQPGKYIWSSSTDGGRTGTGLVFIPYNDPNIVGYNNNTKPIFFTIGVLATSGLSVSYTILAQTTEAVPSLIPGQPTTRQVISRGANAHFQVFIGDISSDLLMMSTVMVGSVVITVSSPGILPTTFGYPGCITPRICNATWSSVVAAQVTDTVRIFAPQGDGTQIGPCLGPYVYTGGNFPWTCSSARDWVPGVYNIGVYGVTDSEYSLTVFTNAGPQSLDDGQPQAGVAVPNNPDSFVFLSQPAATLPDVRVFIASDINPLDYYINSCIEGSCSTNDMLPSPTNFEDSGSVDGGGTDDFFITKFSASYCAAPVGGVCHYYISVWKDNQNSPPCPDPTAPSCAASFTITASIQGGSQPTLINYNSIAGRVFSVSGNVAPGASAIYELYLNESVSADIVLDVDSCGPGYPSVFVCNPNPAAGVTPCTNPFAPGPNGSPGSGGSTISGSTQTNGGTLRLVDTNVQAQTYFIAVTGPTSTNNDGQTDNSGYNIMLSSGTAFYLVPQGSAKAVIAPSDGISVNISWTAATVTDQEKRNPIVANLAQYYVYAAPGGFQKNGGPSTISTTACGLFRYSALTRTNPVGPTDRGITWAIVSGLQPNTLYEFGVVGQCDRTCFNAINPPTSTSENTNHNLHAPGYVTQYIAYGIASTTTGDVPGAPIQSAFPVAGIVGIVAGVIAVLGAAGGFMYYRRAQFGDRSYQYSSLDVSSAMATISTPVDDRLGSIQGGASYGGSSDRSSGFVSTIRNMFSGNNRMGGSGNKALAESDYSTVEDAVSQYM